MNHKISHLKVLQRTTPSGLGAKTFIYCTRTLCQPPTSFLFMWLQKKNSFCCCGRHTNNKIFEQNEPQNISFESVARDNTFWVVCINIHILYQNIVLASYNFFVHVGAEKNCFANVCGRHTQINRFLIKMNHKISHLKVLQQTTTYKLGALASVQCTRTLSLPPTCFLFLWLWNKICFAVVVGTQIITRFLIKMNHKISHLKVLQQTTPSGSGVLASAQCTRTWCLPFVHGVME